MCDIKNEDITVVLQGSTLSEFNNERCIKLSAASVKRVLPGCKIILSTWEGENVPVISEIDKTVYNKDPGFKTRDCKVNGKPNNVNRQIVSSINGLKHVKTKYAMKMRTDFIMTNDNFKRYFDKYNSYEKDYKIFEKRIICNTFGTRKPKAVHFNLPFHISDFTTFGITSDLINLYDIPLVTDEEFEWFVIHNEFMPDTYARNKYNAEQSIWINCLIKNGVDVKCKYSTDVSDEISIQSNHFLINNFYPVLFEKYGVKPLKENLSTKNNIEKFTDYILQYDWLKMYKKYCDKKVLIPLSAICEYLTLWSFLHIYKKNYIPHFIRNLTGYLFINGV